MALQPRTRIDRAPTTARMVGIPVATVMLGSMLTLLPVISTAPLLPPFGFMALVAWRQLHRTLWPVWITLPLGLFDDMLSGQPIGSAILLWTLAFLALELFDRRMIWRDVWQEWGLAALLTTSVLLGGLLVANAKGGNADAVILLPQIIISALLIPMVTRGCALLDVLRRSA